MAKICSENSDKSVNEIYAEIDKNCLPQTKAVSPKPTQILQFLQRKGKTDACVAPPEDILFGASIKIQGPHRDEECVCHTATLAEAKIELKNIKGDAKWVCDNCCRFISQDRGDKTMQCGKCNIAICEPCFSYAEKN